jgi:hypothetical protein
MRSKTRRANGRAVWGTSHSEASTRSVVRVGNKGWSLYGVQRSQPVATADKRGGAENGSNRRKPLPWVATACRVEPMVRRGSTVRVRQRALQNTRKFALSRPRPVAKDEEAHKELLAAGVIPLEGLDLRQAEPGR